MATVVGISTDALESWLWSIGCHRTSCPNEYICIWKAPDGSGVFTAPSPTHIYIIPNAQRGRLAGIIRDIMNS